MPPSTVDMPVRLPALALALAACHPSPDALLAAKPGPVPAAEPAASSQAVLDPASAESTEAPTPEASPEPLPSPSPTAEPISYPTVYCVDHDVLTERWVVRIDPVSKADIRRAERLADRYPNADGQRGALARSNVPAPWRELREVTLVSAEGTATTSVHKVGIRPAPSGGAFVFVLNARPADPHTERAIAIEGHVPTDALRWTPATATPVDEARWTALKQPLVEQLETLRPGRGTPKLAARNARTLSMALGEDITEIVVVTKRRAPGQFPTWSALLASSEDGSLRSMPVIQSDGGRRPGVLEHAFFEPVAQLDLDHDGHAELLVDEHWPEGRFTWLVRVDPASGELVAQRLCGDAS